MPTKLDYRPLFERAVEEEFGLAIETNNVRAHDRYLRDWATENGFLEHVSICVPAIPNEVWLVKKSVELPP